MGKLDFAFSFLKEFFFCNSAYVASKKSTLTLPPACIFSWNSIFATANWTKFAVFQFPAILRVKQCIQQRVVSEAMKF